MSRSEGVLTASPPSQELLQLGLKHPKQEPSHELSGGKSASGKRGQHNTSLTPLTESLLSLGLSGSELQERSRTLPGAGQSSSGRTTFDLLQPCGPGERVILPQRAKDHCVGTGGSQELTES